MENEKKMNVSIWVIIMIIITILAIFAVIVMYEIVKEAKSDLNEIKNVSVVIDEEANVDEEEYVDEEKKIEAEDVKETENEFIQSDIDKIAQVTIEDYLNLANQICMDSESILLKSRFGFGFYENMEDMEQHVERIDGGILTDVKYEDFMTKITEYMTKELFESKYSYLYKNENGYLSVGSRGASGGRSDVLDVELLSEDNEVYSYKAEYLYYEEGYVEDKSFEITFEIEKINNKYVVSKEV